MNVLKNGIVYTLTDKTQIDAFLGSGWAVAEEDIIKSKPAPAEQEPVKAETPKREKK